MANGYEIRYADLAVEDIRALRAFDRGKIMDGVEVHLTHQPTLVSRSRIKAMTQPFWSQYRLRINGFRVYYDVSENDRVVNVLRVLQKTTDQTPEKSP